MRASSLPKKISTRGRATWVERTRSWGAWKVATLSETEWRSAVEEIRGAKGSWTWTTSSSVEASVLFTGSPEPSTRTSWPCARSSSATRETYSLTAFLVARRCGVTWAIERRRAGGTDPRLDDRSPIPARPYDVRATRCLRVPGQAPVFDRDDSAAPATGLFERAWSAMNSSVLSRASSSGRCVWGDFIR